eukprot:Blabericola_migrator_1__10856@NODE_624_length_7189_cov_211_722269_g455_i0_p1_GENE_NODE_624_length_7189_cov_211_722269_g455_i0NODE_624_length_7189_cov_211_722269_g455_i0_p1_ORF_typecomplete_len1149_score218_34RCC1/PF00415_18/3_3e06RCC1/PF00415_18/3_4e09RCC1/PF00415_18/0_69RCC1/PF00415_18/0_073RCC1/PF00415_18/1RCC1/PF00415_18/0_011RCC1/PF00415_18/4e07RCC1_2/PF13540_6/95RCC1_2/PF13540_6/3_9e07RCC1_2/PF13540_6/4_7e07RCC1_2/PF13540_6/0_12RCC1_2/PF13540_6/5_2e03RCC1_2/PF13540_6/0_29RCC1_2/PF13540_6/0_
MQQGLIVSPTNDWECVKCMTPNDSKDVRCAACETYRPGHQPTQTTMPSIAFGGAPAVSVTATEWKPPLGPISFDFNSASIKSAVSKENDKPSPVFGFGDRAERPPQVNAARFTFGRSDQVSKDSTPAKGYRSPKSFCQTMDTPAIRGGSPMLKGLESADIVLRQVPDHVSSANTGCVWTWGSGECDQLAVRSENLQDECYRPLPIIIKAFSTPICAKIAAGSMHTLALHADGHQVYSWGCNDEGALGRPIRNIKVSPVWESVKPPTPDCQLTAARAPGLVWNFPEHSIIKKVSAGGSHSAAITQSGDCYCWGCYRDGTGNIGFTDGKGGTATWYTIDPSEPRPGQPIPTLIPGVEGVCLELVSGENHTAVLTALKDNERRIYLWGAGDCGQLGLEPLPVTERNRTASLTPKGWSLHEFNFQHFESSGPTTGEGVRLVTHPQAEDFKVATPLHVYAGKYTTFFTLETHGTIHTFGFGKNACGELGAGFEKDIVVNPVLLSTTKGVMWTDIKGGEFFTMGLSWDGSVFTWGHRDFVGLGSVIEEGATNVLRPRLIPGLKQKIVAIEAAHRTAFALTKDGQIFAWGDGSSYQIGDGTLYDDAILKPMRVNPSLLDHGFVESVAGGALHTVALVKPWPEEQKRQITAAETMSDTMAEEPRGKKRSRDEFEPTLSLEEGIQRPKKARVKEHQINTDELPAHPCAFPGLSVPGSSTSSSNPPQPISMTPPDDRHKMLEPRPYSLPPLDEEQPSRASQNSMYDTGGTGTPVRLQKPEPGSQDMMADIEEGPYDEEKHQGEEDQEHEEGEESEDEVAEAAEEAEDDEVKSEEEGEGESVEAESEGETESETEEKSEDEGEEEEEETVLEAPRARQKKTKEAPAKAQPSKVSRSTRGKPPAPKKPAVKDSEAKAPEATRTTKRAKRPSENEEEPATKRRSRSAVKPVEASSQESVVSKRSTRGRKEASAAKEVVSASKETKETSKSKAKAEPKARATRTTRTKTAEESEPAPEATRGRRTTTKIPKAEPKPESKQEAEEPPVRGTRRGSKSDEVPKKKAVRSGSVTSVKEDIKPVKEAPAKESTVKAKPKAKAKGAPAASRRKGSADSQESAAPRNRRGSKESVEEAPAKTKKAAPKASTAPPKAAPKRATRATRAK